MLVAVSKSMQSVKLFKHNPPILNFRCYLIFIMAEKRVYLSASSCTTCGSLAKCSKVIVKMSVISSVYVTVRLCIYVCMIVIYL